jgi:D-amino-acid dehydrogenase
MALEDQARATATYVRAALVGGLVVRGVTVREDTGPPDPRRDGRAVGVLAGAAGDEVAADIVVLAAGAWSPALARSLGLRLPIQPATGYSSTLPTWPGAPRHPVFVGDSRVIVLPLGDRVRFAGTLELAGFRRSGDPMRSRAVLEAGRGALREPPPDAPVEHWFGFRPLMPDDLPAIGWAPR